MYNNNMYVYQRTGISACTKSNYCAWWCNSLRNNNIPIKRGRSLESFRIQKKRSFLKYIFTFLIILEL